jgi:hypothetical protein
MDFLADLEHLTRQELSALGFADDPRGADLNTILTRYYNVKSRTPRRAAWTVLHSTEVSRKLSNHTLVTKPDDIDKGLRQFIKKAENGGDLRPHLSTRIADPDYQDLMFYDWSTYHFHLGTKPHPKCPGFIARTNELLFAITDPYEGKMYLIDVHPHTGAFENQDLIRIIETDWPEILSAHKLKSISVKDPGTRSDEDVKGDRQEGLNVFTSTPSGNPIAPLGGGITTAGTSAANQLAADQDRSKALRLQKTVEKDRPSIEEHFKKHYNLIWDDLDIRLTSFVPSFAVIETRTGEVLQY